MNFRGKVILISGLVVFVLTNVLFFMLTKERTDITWLGYVFILFAEIDFFGGLILIEFLANKNSQIIIRTGIGFTITAYMLLTIAVSLIYMIFSINSVTSFLAIQLTIFAIAFILTVIFYGIAKAVKIDSDNRINAAGRISELVHRLNLLKSSNENKPYGRLLDKMIDELRYGDTSTTVPIDVELDALVTKLEIAILKEHEGKEKEVTSIFEEILLTINKRKQMIKNVKVGGI